ncbi:ribonuclease-like 3 [Sander lucioperca]|uniref:ribonuclease-like 3 n=1 Tax=Sander lucioperca TaxID=283035 RepID=UPI00125E935B|nr:ribonuclease-like 3 [Sander lucioperca]
MNRKSCDAVIKQRKISETNSKKCKKENTFISASYGIVQKICGDEGEPYPGNQNLRISLKKFRVVNCKCNKNKSLPHCKCRGSDANLRIVISCDNKGNPVHYEKGVKILN